MKGRLTVLFMLGVIVGMLGFSTGYWWLNTPAGAEAEAPATPRLRNFESLERLESWLRDDDTDGVIAENFMWCGEVAELLMGRAEASGYRLSMDVINYEEFNEFYETGHTLTCDAATGECQLSLGWPRLSENQAHAVCSATIGDEVYYIEPRTDRVWFYGTIMR